MTLKSVFFCMLIWCVNYENVLHRLRKEMSSSIYQICNENWYVFFFLFVLYNVVCTSMQLDFETGYAEEWDI